MKFLYQIWIIALFVTSLSSFAQEKNFVIKNESDCSSLTENFNSKQEALNEIESKQFRDKQSFRINRKNGVKSGNFYSCDNSTGFLKLMIDDDTLLFVEVTKEIWEQLTQSNDPDYFVQTELMPQFWQIE